MLLDVWKHLNTSSVFPSIIFSRVDNTIYFEKLKTKIKERGKLAIP
jgi:hypothetical protein